MANWISTGANVIADGGDEIKAGVLQSWKYESASGGAGPSLYRSISSTPRAWIVLDGDTMPTEFHFGDVRKDTPTNRDKMQQKIERRKVAIAERRKENGYR